MVLIQRRSIRTSSFSSVMFGDGCTTGLESFEPPPDISPESGRARSFSFDDKKKRTTMCRMPYSWVNKLLLFVLLLSWGSSFFVTKGAWLFLRELKTEVKVQQTQYGETKQDMMEAKEDAHFTQKHVDHMIHAKEVMNHESKIAKELDDTGHEPVFTQHGPVLDWLGKRQGKLKDKLGALRKYVAERSRAQVIERYGPGPHRVRATVEIAKTGVVGSFVIEMAPVDLMPHAILMFLGQVEKGLWDRTVFWHYDVVEHVISAASLNYNTGEPKTHYFEALGVGELAYAEYSPDYPHTEFTVGFAGRGPHFYINTMDNTKLHGPGGQGHHDLPGDADPCFGKVVEGTGIVNSMYKTQLQEKKPAAERTAWQDEDLTHILSMKIV